MTPILLCTVRDCRQPLSAKGRTWICPQGHSYDTARSGYVNLLQPQDRRSRFAGDGVDVLAARRRLVGRGIEARFIEAIEQRLAEGPLLDAGCGEVFYTPKNPELLYGVDISASAIDLAARRHPQGHFVVANADRLIPYAAASFAMALSITGRLNPTEFRRVLREEGQLLVVVPGPDDLVELRGLQRDRVERNVEMFAPAFVLADHARLRERIALDRTALRDLAVSTYRPKRIPDSDRLDVTLCRDLLLFEVA
jgi:23S rRNA (guanine745-N1)-methyltransferase